MSTFSFNISVEDRLKELELQNLANYDQHSSPVPTDSEALAQSGRGESHLPSENTTATEALTTLKEQLTLQQSSKALDNLEMKVTDDRPKEGKDIDDWDVCLTEDAGYISAHNKNEAASCQIREDDRAFAGREEEEIQFVNLSRVHFEIRKEKGEITLMDTSMNGTYVNKLLVGKGKKYRLTHADVISVLADAFNFFLYLDEKTNASLYSARISSKYLVGRELGKGSSAVVREGFSRDKISKVSLKFIYKKKWPSNLSQPQDLLKEVNILQELKHPCITKVLDAVEDENMLVIVMEYAAGG